MGTSVVHRCTVNSAQVQGFDSMRWRQWEGKQVLTRKWDIVPYSLRPGSVVNLIKLFNFSQDLVSSNMKMKSHVLPT